MVQYDPNVAQEARTRLKERESFPSTRLPLRIGNARTRRRRVEVEAAQHGDFQRRMQRIEPGHEAEHID
jgi:hypothetical protein